MRWGKRRSTYLVARSGNVIRHASRSTFMWAGALVIVLLIVQTVGGCSGGKSPGTGGSTTSTTAGKGTSLQGVVGQELDVGPVKLLVAALAPVAVPLSPTVVMEPTLTPSQLGPGQSFFQTWVSVRNSGTLAVRIDPRDFTLVNDKRGYSVDPTRSGPPGLSLLPGGSVDLILTFELPSGAVPELVYRPTWYPGTVIVKGQMKPTPVVMGRFPGLLAPA
jgi:hypothetical protein